MLPKTDWASLIPHAGAMCLLDAVQAWDASTIHAISAGHARADNPLRGTHGLHAVHLAEYGAQAMAVHGALVAASAPLTSTLSIGERHSTGPAVGYLASVRNVALHVTRLDDLEAELIAAAERVTGDGRTVMYEFTVSSARHTLLSGRASIVVAGIGP